MKTEELNLIEMIGQRLRFAAYSPLAADEAQLMGAHLELLVYSLRENNKKLEEEANKLAALASEWDATVASLINKKMKETR